MGTSWSPNQKPGVCVCVCTYACVYTHIQIPSQSPGPERSIGEDAAPPTCYPGKEAKKERRGLPRAFRKQEVDLVDFDSRHQASSILSTLPPPPCPPEKHPAPISVLIWGVKSLFSRLKFSLSRAVGVDVQMSDGTSSSRLD